MEQKKTILIVDDIKINRAAYRMSLCGQYQLLEAENGQIAIDMMMKESIDLIILDIVMPVMDGIEVLKYRKTQPQLAAIPVIVVTAVEDSDLEITVLELGADDVLRKPFDYRVLCCRIENVMRSCSAVALSKENEVLKRVQHLEHQLSALMRGATGGIFRLCYTDYEDLSKERFEYANEAFYRMRGVDSSVPASELSSDRGIMPEDYALLMTAIKHAIAARKQSISTSFRIVRPGGVRYIESEAGITYSEDAIYLDVMERDVTEQRVMRAQLLDMTEKHKEYMKLFYSLLNHIPGGVAIFESAEKGTRIVFANESVCELFGYTQEEYRRLTSKNALIGVHPDDLESVQQEIRRAIVSNTEFVHTFRNKKKNGEYLWITLRASIIERAGEHVIGYGSYADIDMLKERAEKDSLTGIYNRQAFVDLVGIELTKKKLEKRAMLMIDLDRFKDVNDTFGHMCGDDVLREVARRISAIFRGEDIIARVGGDEFCVFITRALSKEVILTRVSKLSELLDLNIEKDGINIAISSSIGIAYSDKSRMDFETLYKAADDAQYFAKRNGKNCFCVAGDWENFQHKHLEHQECLKLDTIRISQNEKNGEEDE